MGVLLLRLVRRRRERIRVMNRPRRLPGVAFLLHAHLPFVRHPEHPRFLEEDWFFQAAVESYIPIGLLLERLAADGIDARLTVGVSPTLAAMMTDRLLVGRLEAYIESRVRLAEREAARTVGDASFNPLARGHLARLESCREAFVRTWRRDLTLPFRRLRQAGRIEMIATAATHGFLPLLASHPSSVRAQIVTGIAEFSRVFGGPPRGIWLPECGYYEGLDEMLLAEGVAYTVLETHALLAGRPPAPYGTGLPVATEAGLVVFGRDRRSSLQVWSRTEGYPADEHYREYHRDIGYDLEEGYLSADLPKGVARTQTGIKYYAIGRGGPRPYDPDLARARAQEHARHFVEVTTARCAALATRLPVPPVIVAPYDAELFGHWWHEGPLWLEEVLRLIAARSDAMSAVSLEERAVGAGIGGTTAPSPSSWGLHGYSESWISPSCAWICEGLERAGAEMVALVRELEIAGDGLRARGLRQAARELMLAEASDWAFLISTGSAPDYASARAGAHIEAFDRLATELRADRIDSAWLASLEERDNLFPDVHPALYM